MAEGWLRHFAGDRLEVYSAGNCPKGLHPLAVQVMAERGVDISRHTCNHVDEYIHQRFDLVMTVCDNVRAACPTFGGLGLRVHQPFDDPDEPGRSDRELIPLFRRVRDEIGDWVRQWVLTDLTPE